MFTLEDSIQYIQLGCTHVIPFGLDHILFIITLFLPCKNLRSVIIQCSVFTIAHSISLGIATVYAGIIPAKIIEPLIALTILIAAIYNLLPAKNNNPKLLLIFIFGLIHGVGFANALSDLLANHQHLLAALFFFNVGVEIGQIAVIALCYWGIKKLWAHQDWYQRRIVFPLSCLIACIAVYWIVIRLITLN